ncbi:TolC family protein [Teredinibacter purpureus]|uniref:TolC family protein n=1 Tax=Teredinibacter purpureus TaxID=2731756 RepID=UPI000B1F5D95|nr:TolC family protein [Teredinibacter purpureus]
MKTIKVRNTRSYTNAIALAIGVWLYGLSVAVMAEPYTLNAAVRIAQTVDPWITGSVNRQESLESLGAHAGTLPDPMVSIAVANLPFDSFDVHQEAMTQFKIGVTQTIPRGNTRALTREKLMNLSEAQPFARDERRASVAVTVSHLWLEVYRYQHTIGLIERDRHLFEHLVDVSQSSYTSASGRTRQQDVIRAQLELTQLDDRLTRLRQQRDTALAGLIEWLPYEAERLTIASSASVNVSLTPAFSAIHNKGAEQLTAVLMAHPKIKGFERNIAASTSNIHLVNQSYKPQWGLNASYGYRDSDPTGNTRADLFSAGVSFDMPFFTGNKQDKKVQAATAQREIIKTNRALALRQLKAGLDTASVNYYHLQERQRLLDTRLLKELSQQAEASLSAYISDEASFSDVVRARIAELNSLIESLNVDVDTKKSIVQINYFLVGAVAITQHGDRHEHL